MGGGRRHLHSEQHGGAEGDEPQHKVALADVPQLEPGGEVQEAPQRHDDDGSQHGVR